MVEYSIILPTYNEKENIKPLIKEIITYMPSKDYELVIVDDNSPDGTGKIVQELSKVNRSIKVIIRTEDKGLSKSIKQGILRSKGSKIIIMDTDFSHPSSTIPHLIKSLDNNSDMVVASRYVKYGHMDAPLHKYFGSYMLNRIIGIILNVDIMDLTGGFLIIKKSSLMKLSLDKVFVGYGEFSFRLIYALKRNKGVIKEIPFNYALRRYGESKTSLIKIGLKYIYEAFKTRFVL